MSTNPTAEIIAELSATIDQLKRERDAAVEAMQEAIAKHNSVLSALTDTEERLDDVCRADICFQRGNDAGGIAWMEKAFDGWRRITERKL